MRLVFTAILVVIIVAIACGILITVAKRNPPVAHTSSPKTSDNTHSEILPSNFADGWPMFRGGRALLGIASSFALDSLMQNSRTVLTSTTQTNGKLPDSFDLRWKFKTGDAVKSSAAIGGGHVFIGSDDGRVYALDIANGQKIWSFQTEGTVESSPCFLNDSIFVGSSDSFLYALDAETGKLKWKYKTEDKILGAVNWAFSPLNNPLAPFIKGEKGVKGLFSPKGDRALILVGSYDNKLHCVDSVTGEGVWTYETSNYINGAPAIAEGKAVFGGCDGMIHVVSIADGKEIIKIGAGSYIAGSAALAGKRVYVGNYDGTFLCADIAEGKIIWNYESTNFPFFSSPAIGETQVVFGSRDRNLHCVERKSGKSLWTFQTRGKVDSSPVICSDKVVVGSDDGRLYVVSLSDGKELWSYEIGDAVTGSPAIANGMIVIGSEDGYVYAFGPKP